MEAATKNKRGRPRVFDDTLYAIFNDQEKRVAQNSFYCGYTVRLMEQKNGDFFVTNKGAFRRKGIAEQIGRMVLQDGYSDDDAKMICNKAIALIENGYSVKAVEQLIRRGRLTGEW